MNFDRNAIARKLAADSCGEGRLGCAPESGYYAGFDLATVPGNVTANETLSTWLTIIGIGEDGLAGLGDAARAALRDAQFIVGSSRQLDLLPTDIAAQRQAWPSPFALTPVLERRGQPVCVLASGDPMLFGVGATLARQLSANEMNVLPAPSSYSLAAARLGWPLQDVELCSIVARPLAALRTRIFPNARLLVLSNDGTSPTLIAQWLCEHGFGASRVSVLEHLGGAHERRIDGIAINWSVDAVAALNLVAIECIADENAAIFSPAIGLPDSAFRHDGQLTKRDVRAITLSRLAPVPGELLWDVGAGCGSIAIEWLRVHPKNRAIAIEANEERQRFIEHNRDALGVPHLQLVKGSAPTALANLPTPDAIFIGGGVTETGMLDICWQSLRSGGRLIANAVTLQSELVLQQWRERHGGELTRIQIAHAQPLGEFDTWRGALPITLLEVKKSEVRNA